MSGFHGLSHVFCFEYVFGVVRDLVPFQDSQKFVLERFPSSLWDSRFFFSSLPQVETWGYLPSSLWDVCVPARWECD
jgi:hypothetical protein